ncbi:MAG: response regulator transcription factor [Hyphomicrobium sp.]|nr:response regulator transcription factor [Hyphomicrobium sp.]
MKVLIVEDHAIVISGCRTLFSEDEGVTVIEARSLAAARAVLETETPDVIVLDINLPDGSGLDLTREIVRADPNAKVIVFSMSDAPLLAIQAIDCGAKGYVSKNDDPMGLRDAVLALVRGETWLTHELAQEIALIKASGNGVATKLTERELLTLRLLVRGRSMAEVGSDLDVSYKTVAADCASIRQKLNARTSSEMVRIAVELRIV